MTSHAYYVVRTRHFASHGHVSVPSTRQSIALPCDTKPPFFITDHVKVDVILEGILQAHDPRVIRRRQNVSLSLYVIYLDIRQACIHGGWEPCLMFENHTSAPIYHLQYREKKQPYLRRVPRMWRALFLSHQHTWFFMTMASLIMLLSAHTTPVSFLRTRRT